MLGHSGVNLKAASLKHREKKYFFTLSSRSKVSFVCGRLEGLELWPS
jgi:hypothetical protein